jgi:hypothetical protein
MAYQNINQYNYKKLYLLNKSEIQDFCLASDERDYNLEVIFSDKLIGENDGNVLPISFDLNSSGSSELFVLNYDEYIPENNLVSLNYYNPKNEDLTCFSAFSLCDIGLTGTDNGLVDQMSGYTINVTQGLFDDSLKFERLYFDRRFKFHQVTGYTQVGVNQFSGLEETMKFNIVSKLDDKIGIYHELYGGFYQGFYKLHGFDYNIFPERVNKGWSVEMLLKPRLVDEFGLASGETTLNNFYPQNKDIFFYFGTRAENKYYHYADGEPVSGYTRVTSGLNCIETCACCDTGITVSRCIYVYPPTPVSAETNNTCGEVTKTCGWEPQTHACPPTVTTTTTVECSECSPCNSCLENCDPPSTIEYTCETDPLDDSMSNGIALKLCGDPKNPKIGVKILLFTGGCETTGSCENTGITYTTGYTILELCTDKGIYDECVDISQEFLNKEKWFLVDAVWERYKNLEDCDLCWKGGLCVITKEEYYESLAGNSVKLIDTSKCNVNETITLSKLNESWLDEKEFRMGRLKIYVNGRKFQTFEDIEEIIPRSLYTEKEKQIGVPFNISWGGGTQGLHNHLVFSGCPTSLTGLIYQQDPELFPNNILSGTSLSALTTNILLEQNFGGTFDGGISQFRMYVEPLSSDEVKHNFKLLKDKFDLFDYDCPNCCLDNDFRYAFCDVNYEYIPVNLIEIFITYSEGSIVANFEAITENNVDTNLNISFTNTLGVKTGDSITFDVSLQIQSGSITGNTIINLDENYNNLNYESYFSGITISAESISNYVFKVIFNFTFIDQILIDPIITDNGEYISVGENEYLQFVDPPPQQQNIFNAILTNVGQYISVGINEFLSFFNSESQQTNNNDT